MVATSEVAAETATAPAADDSGRGPRRAAGPMVGASFNTRISGDRALQELRRRAKVQPRSRATSFLV